MALEAIRDQPRAVELLRRALDTGRVAHAYAFVGPAGSGRTTAALAFAGALLCQTGSGCGRCRACALVAQGRHPDLHVTLPTPPESSPRGARAIRIDAIRALERQGALRPVLGGRRVFVLDDCERMTGEAPQAFLKFLEEPPPGTVVILVLPRPGAVPATVVSRCQLVRFLPRTADRAVEAAREAAALVEAARERGAAELFRRTERVDRERAEALVDGAWMHCRDLLLARCGAPAGLLSDGDRAQALARDAARFTDDELVAAIGLCRRAREALAHNVSPRLTLEVVLGRLAFRAA